MLKERMFEIQPNGDAALDIRFDQAPGELLSERIIALADAIESASIRAVTELVPAYQCLTVCFDPLRLPGAGSGAAEMSELENTLRALTNQILSQETYAHSGRSLIRIPVCYDSEFAPDMHTVCEQSGLTAQEVVSRHTAPRYLVHMLGFTPGFLYLGGLDQKLHCPRKARPALNVPAGSVGIGGAQTGIYPQATPGGWQIIGRTPLALFRPQQQPAFIARPLDRVQFVAISAEQFAAIDPLTAMEKFPLDAPLPPSEAG
ncbi:5-oxoprolinase subunit PxpB [Microbulbifer hydrolyticus]|uniref:5-oxoprolinase subunit PxpB n=1 Tax=Microbulbifer hydrolyticus TaxID=48074 RepID=A0A6P1TEW3_9GAMM|nr:5-oxoprolinase subunit PxpB [Microbulbifer hydrolyticus]MBB5212462.1 inhibitor of KinA [Microbulbifer hydrolyticus]QHQ40090.1 5-oxoprolinase subunit PxpB [Microbulbifer hydrolyticus]